MKCGTVWKGFGWAKKGAGPTMRFGKLRVFAQMFIVKLQGERPEVRRISQIAHLREGMRHLVSLESGCAMPNSPKIMSRIPTGGIICCRENRRMQTATRSLSEIGGRKNGFERSRTFATRMELYRTAQIRPVNVGPGLLARDLASTFAVNCDRQGLTSRAQSIRDVAQMPGSGSAANSERVTLSRRHWLQKVLQQHA